MKLALGWNMKIQVPVHIPTPLRKLTQNQEIVRIEGATIKDVINNLEQSYRKIRPSEQSFRLAQSLSRFEAARPRHVVALHLPKDESS
jgi:molybdopterin converting factor small subunit